jgi:hypothetical protein
MARRAEQYRHLAQECRNAAEIFPPGSSSQIALLEMAEVWERLANEQERATDLRKSPTKGPGDGTGGNRAR